MSCHVHPNMGAVGRCARCGREVCAICATRVGDVVVCRDCAPEERSRPAPVAAEPVPEAAEPGCAPGQTAPAQSPVFPGEGATAAPSAPVVALPSRESLAEADLAAAGGRRKKEALLSAALSLVIPGAGQAYNGQPVKGVLLAAAYFGTIVIVVGCTALLAVIQPLTSCCCLPVLALPLAVLVVAVYEAYRTAEKINGGLPSEDWL